MKSNFKLLLAAGTALAVSSAAAFAGAGVDAIMKRGELLCGVSGALGGFSLPDSKGVMQGLDADVAVVSRLLWAQRSSSFR